MTKDTAPGRWPSAGVVRLHPVPGALPRLGDEPGTNRFDDPRPRTIDRFLIRYAATALRGCLLELLAGFRDAPEANEREAEIDVNDPDLVPAPVVEQWQYLADYLADRRVAHITADRPRVVSINDPRLQHQLNSEPAVRAVLDTAAARGALLEANGGHQVHLDNAAVRLSSDLGRHLTQACALALYDRTTPPDVIHYRSRHDDAEDCWAIYHHVEVVVSEPDTLSPTFREHIEAVQSVAQLWSLPLPPDWR